MKIDIVYKSGRVQSYDTASLTAADPFTPMARDGDARNVMTMFDLRSDLIEEGRGLRLDVFFFTAYGQAETEVVDVEGARQPTARFRLATSIVIATASELERASAVYASVGDRTSIVAWRQGEGNWLINGAKFESAQMTYYTDSQVTSTNCQAIQLVRYIMAADPDKTARQAAAEIGYPYDAYVDICQSEAAARRDAMRGGEGPAGGDALDGPHDDADDAPSVDTDMDFEDPDEEGGY